MEVPLTTTDSEKTPCDHPSTLEKVCSKDTDAQNDTSPADEDVYGWVVVFASFLMHTLVGGNNRGYGVIFIQLRHRFADSAAITAWVGGIVIGLRFLASPVGSMIANRFSARAAMMCGACIMSAGCVITGFATSTEYTILSYGVLLGLGGTFVYAPSLVLVGQYFTKRRGIALGLATCGSGLGLFTFPPMMSYLFKEYGFMGAMVLIGGIMLHLVVSGALHRPLPHCKKYAHTPTQKPAYQETQNEVMQQIDDVKYSNINVNHEKRIDSTCAGSLRSMEKADGTYSKVDSCENINTTYDLLEKNEKSMDRDIEKIEKKVCSYLDLSLLREPVFVMLGLAQLFHMMSTVPIDLLLPDMGRSKGLQEHQAVFLLSSLGIADLVGRLLSGWICDLPYIRSRWHVLYGMAMLVKGFITLVLAYSSTRTSLIITTIVWGFDCGFIAAQVVNIAVYLVGVERLSSSYSLIVAFQGVGALIGPSTAGYLYDVTGAYLASFLFSSVLAFLAAAFLFLAIWTHTDKNHRRV